VHDVVFDSLNLDRAECAETDMEGQAHPDNPARRESGENLLSEVKPSGGSGYRAWSSGVYGLVRTPVSG
jgi:hypothetical protein